MVRPPTAACAAVHDRGDGALRILWHAGTADALPGAAFSLFRPDHDRPLRRLYRAGLSDSIDRRPDGRPLPGIEALGQVRRHPDEPRLPDFVLRRTTGQAICDDRRPTL